jgi:hypothetical protein
MKRPVLMVLMVLSALVTPQQSMAQNGAAGAPVAPATPAPPAQREPPRPTVGTAAGASPRNIRFDIAIADSGVTAPITKVVTLNVSQGGNGSIRSSARIPGAAIPPPRTVTSQGPDGKPQTTTNPSPAPSIALNVDVNNPTIYEDGGIRAFVIIEYQPYMPRAAALPEPAVVRANSMVVLESGKKMTLLQASDPMTDRRTTIEITATVVR